MHFDLLKNNKDLNTLPSRRPHKCPSPRAGGGALLSRLGDANVVSRVARRELGLRAPHARQHARLAHAHFAPVRTLRLQDDDAYFTHTIFHVSTL